jgi:thymidylate kinase
MIITFEGMDGSGKTVVAKSLSKKLNFEYINKATALLYSEDTNGENISKYMNSRDIIADMPSEIRAFYFSLETLIPHLVLKSKYKNMIIDRGLASNYFWSQREFSSYGDEFYNLVLSIAGKPDLTVLLYADTYTRLNRILARNSSDNDLKDRIINSDSYEIYRSFLNRFSIPFVELNTCDKSIETVTNEISAILVDMFPTL